MNRFFYPRLALNNIKKNSQTYFPYILTCIGTIMMFYNMCFLANVKELGNIGGDTALRTILGLGTGIIGIFSVIFLFYTNSFLIKKRKKEFGLFNILGMEKKHIARIMFFETLFTALISLAAGILLGILLSRLLVLLLLKLISFQVTFGFEIPASAVAITIVLFCGIFLLNLVKNILQVHLSNPVELLKGGNTGEKEPKTKWPMAAAGAVCLGAGYYIALTTESPLAALSVFFIAVVLVIVGTYCLFTAGSIAILKILRRNKKYYYTIKHFTSVSGMIYRMKQNAAGLANICILSTMVIVMVSTTVSLYIGMEDVLRARYRRNIAVTAWKVSDSLTGKLDGIIGGQIEKAGIVPQNVVRYRHTDVMAVQDGASFTGRRSSNVDMSGDLADAALVTFITLDEYNRMDNKSESLSDGETLLYTLKGSIPKDAVDFGGLKLSIKKRLETLPTEGGSAASLTYGYYMIVKDEDTIGKIIRTMGGSEDDAGLSYYYGFDVDGGRDVQIKIVDALNAAFDNNKINNAYAEGAERSRSSFYTLYGGLFFLGMFLGLLFVMATVLIIYYKQIAEGFDDRDRFAIMQKVGMSRDEVKKSIRSQILTVFFAPLAVAVIHLLFAFRVITKLLTVFNLTNVPLFAACTAVTIIVFALFYTAVYALTARTYYRIVS